MKEEPERIPDDLIANIPVLGSEAERRGAGAEEVVTFVPVDDEVILVAPNPDPLVEDPKPTAAPPTPGQASAVVAQLRYEMGEVFARELDRAEATFIAALGDLETRLAAAEKALVSSYAQAQEERELREQTEARLKAFKDLALR